MITSLLQRAARARARRAAVPPVPTAELPALLARLAAAGHRLAVEAGPGTAGSAADLVGLLPAGSDLCLPADTPFLRQAARTAAGRSVTLTLRPADDASAVDPVEAVDALLPLVAQVRRRAPEVGVRLDPRLRRTEKDCRSLSGRVQLVRGTAPLAPAVSWPAADADLATVRCLDTLLAGRGAVAVEGADPQLARLAAERAAWHTRPDVGPDPRPLDSWELLMPYTRPTPPLAAPVRLLVPVAASAAPAAAPGLPTSAAPFARLTDGEEQP